MVLVYKLHCKLDICVVDKLVHYKDSNHIAVYHKGRFFKVYIYYRGRLLKPVEIEKYVHCVRDFIMTFKVEKIVYLGHENRKQMTSFHYMYKLS